MKNRRNLASFTQLTAIACLLCGCAYLKSTTTKTYDVTNTNKVSVVTSVRVYTLFDSQAALAKFNNHIDPHTQGTSIGRFEESSTTTNLNELIGTVVSSAVSAAIKGATK